MTPTVSAYQTPSEAYIEFKLFKIQKKAIRIITGSNYNAHTAPLFLQQKILPFESIVKSMDIQTIGEKGLIGDFKRLSSEGQR